MALWVVRAGDRGQQEEGALKNNIVTIGWNKLEDLSRFTNFESFYNYFKQTYPQDQHNKPTDYDKSSRLMAGEVWAFLKKINIGDLVGLPSKKSQEIFIGKIIGDYEYKKITDNIKHTRRVEWLKTINRAMVRVLEERSLQGHSELGKLKEETLERILEGKEKPQEKKVQTSDMWGSI